MEDDVSCSSPSTRCVCLCVPVCAFSLHTAQRVCLSMDILPLLPHRSHCRKAIFRPSSQTYRKDKKTTTAMMEMKTVAASEPEKKRVPPTEPNRLIGQPPPPHLSLAPQPVQSEEVNAQDLGSNAAADGGGEEAAAIISIESLRGARLHRRLICAFGILTAALLCVVVAISIKLAANLKTCSDFSGTEKQLITDAVNSIWQPNMWNAIYPLTASPPDRLSPGACSINNLVYIHGGVYGSVPLGIPYVTRTDMWAYSEYYNTWTKISQKGDVPPARFQHSFIDLDDQVNIIMYGGFNVFNTETGHAAYSDLYLFNINTDVWTLLDSNTTAHGGPTARGAHAAVWFQGSMIMFGGFPVIAATGQLRELWKYTLATRTWVDITATAGVGPEGRIGFSFLMLNSTTALLTAGGCAAGNCPTDYYYMPLTNTWAASNATRLNAARKAAGGDSAVGQMVYEFGGLLQVGASATLYNDLAVLDTVYDRWLPLYPNYGRGALPPKTFGHVMVRIGQRCVLFGGRVGLPTSPGSSQLWEYSVVAPVSS